MSSMFVNIHHRKSFHNSAMLKCRCDCAPVMVMIHRMKQISQSVSGLSSLCIAHWIVLHVCNVGVFRGGCGAKM